MRINHRKKKAIVGIEAAIVLIAFVIVAAALAFVALNMGLFTTQKSKEVMQRGLGEASTALEVDGSVMGSVTSSQVDTIIIPIKVAPGRGAVDLSQSKITVRLIAGGQAYEDIYTGVASPNPVTDTSVGNLVSLVTSTPEAKAAFIISDGDNVLEFGEKAVMIVKLPSALGPYEKVSVEIRPPEGAPLTVERTIPATLPSSGGAVDLG